MPTADQIKNAIGSNAAKTIDPPYAAIFEFPLLFLFPLILLGSTFKFSAVEEEEVISNEGPVMIGDDVVCVLEVRDDDCVVKAEVELTTTATMRRAEINLFMMNIY